MPKQSLPQGVPVARGNTSDVWPWTPQTVVKVLHAGIPRHWASIEADILWRVGEAGLPVPAIEGVVEIDGRPGIVLERINGPTMWERMKRAPREVSSLIARLVGLQTQLHVTEVAGLPDLARRLGSKVDEAVQLPAHERRRAQSLLARLPGGSGLCHGDFHPANIVMSRRGMVILDWFDAATGHATADFVRSSLLMRPPEARSTWLSGATPRLLERVHCQYLRELSGRGLVEAATFAPWEAVVAVARMSEPVPVEDLLTVWRRWRSEGEAGAGSMIEGCLGRPETQSPT